MPRYELTCRDAAGRMARRVLFADEDSEVAELIAQEGLREATVRPSLRLDRPRPRFRATVAGAASAPL